LRLSRRFEPFDSDQFVFELKIDGFRSLADIENGKCDLVSHNGNTFRNFDDLAQWIGEHLRIENAVTDGEIACVDESGRPVFNDLCCFGLGGAVSQFEFLEDGHLSEPYEQNTQQSPGFGRSTQWHPLHS
jgi:ATP dependent DNA ligase domain